MNSTKYKYVTLRGTTCPDKFKIGERYEITGMNYGDSQSGVAFCLNGNPYYVLTGNPSKCTYLHGYDCYWELVEPKEKIKFEKNAAGFYDYSELVDYKTANAFLKQKFGKNWCMKIDVDKLDMNNIHYCVLGQLGGEYRLVMEKLFRRLSCSGGVFGYKTTINWKKKIAKRQAKIKNKLKSA